jgi:hypothetical protein
MRFAYQRFPTPFPIVSLDGRAERPKAIIAVRFVGPLIGHPLDSLLDTGADDTVLPDWMAAKIGIDLTHAPIGSARGVAAQFGALRYAKVTLRVADNFEQCEWQGWAGFTTAALNRPLLGYAGFLQFFSAHFHGDREVVELTANSAFPGQTRQFTPPPPPS